MATSRRTPLLLTAAWMQVNICSRLSECNQHVTCPDTTSAVERHHCGSATHMLSGRLCRACPLRIGHPALSCGIIIAAAKTGRCRRSTSSSSSTSGSMDPLSHSSAVCIIPPRDVWDQIQEIRCFKCANFAVNLPLIIQR